MKIKVEIKILEKKSQFYCTHFNRGGGGGVTAVLSGLLPTDKAPLSPLLPENWLN